MAFRETYQPLSPREELEDRIKEFRLLAHIWFICKAVVVFLNFFIFIIFLPLPFSPLLPPAITTLAVVIFKASGYRWSILMETI